MVSRLSFVHRQLSIRIIMPLPDTPRRRLDCCGLLKEFLHSMKLLLFVSGDDNTFRSGLTNFEAGRLWCRLSSLRQQPERLHHNTRASIRGQTIPIFGGSFYDDDRYDFPYVAGFTFRLPSNRPPATRDLFRWRKYF